MVDRKSKQEISELVKKIEGSRDSLSIRVGLDPRKDYINADLADVDFSGRDLREVQTLPKRISRVPKSLACKRMPITD